MKTSGTRSLTVLTILVVLSTIGTWIFVNNAENCLSRDFVEHALPAFCWRETNDYEHVISYSDGILAALIKLTTVSLSGIISLKIINKGISKLTHMLVTGLLIALSLASLIYIITIFRVFSSTTYNNNNHALNNAYLLAYHIGIPLFIGFTTSATVFVLSHIMRQRTLQ